MRDAGHNYNWDFNKEWVREAYLAAQCAGVDFFEIGYRQPKEAPVGDFGHCEDTFISELLAGIIGEPKLLVMIDTGKVNITDFEFAAESPIYGVRVAFYPDEVDMALEQAEYLLEHGYKVFLNPMVTVRLQKKHLEKIAAWKHLKEVEAVYIADSFGSFLPGDVKALMETFKGFDIPALGFHAHNNLDMAVGNTLEAFMNGIDYADITIGGEGRGAGNAKAEIITGIVPGYNPLPYLDLLQKWKMECSGVLTGLHAVHPYYGENALKMVSCSKAAKLFTEKELPISYNFEAMVTAIKEMEDESN